jgi:hypothetical protein
VAWADVKYRVSKEFKTATEKGPGVGSYVVPPTRKSKNRFMKNLSRFGTNGASGGRGNNTARK